MITKFMKIIKIMKLYKDCEDYESLWRLHRIRHITGRKKQQAQRQKTSFPKESVENADLAKPY